MARPSSIGTRDVQPRGRSEQRQNRGTDPIEPVAGDPRVNTRATRHHPAFVPRGVRELLRAVDETTRALRDARAVAVTASQRVERQAVVAQLEGRLAELWDEVRAAWARSGRRASCNRPTRPLDGQDEMQRASRALVDAVFGPGRETPRSDGLVHSNDGTAGEFRRGAHAGEA